MVRTKPEAARRTISDLSKVNDAGIRKPRPDPTLGLSQSLERIAAQLEDTQMTDTTEVDNQQRDVEIIEDADADAADYAWDIGGWEEEDEAFTYVHVPPANPATRKGAPQKVFVVTYEYSHRSESDFVDMSDFGVGGVYSQVNDANKEAQELAKRLCEDQPQPDRYKERFACDGTFHVKLKSEQYYYLGVDVEPRALDGPSLVEHSVDKP